MEVLYPRCAGLDVHAANVVHCVRLASGATVTYEHRTFSTRTQGLLELAERRCTAGSRRIIASCSSSIWLK